MSTPSSDGADPPLTPWPIDLFQLRENIRALVALDATSDPVTSCYLEVTTRGFAPIERKAAAIRRSLAPDARRSFDDALAPLRELVASGLSPATRGLAAFSRAGTAPFFMAMQFQVPVEDQLSIAPTASIFGLIELKDTYERYVVLIVTDAFARILEISLGAVTAELWAARPELRDRTAGLTREQYQHHRRDRSDAFVKEKVAILERLLAKRGHGHLIIVGSPTLSARVRAALPARLAAKVVEVGEISPLSSTSEVVPRTIQRIIAKERAASLDTAACPLREIQQGGLAVAGVAGALAALEVGQVDVLVMTPAFRAPASWKCESCGAVALQDRPASCHRCRDLVLHPVSVREELVQLAERHNTKVELVHDSAALEALGGIGCLLRYRQGWRPEPA